MDKKQIDKISKLSRLKLTEEEQLKIPEQLEKILEYVDQLKELDTSAVKPIEQPLGSLMSRLRLNADEVSEFKEKKKLHEIAPDFEDGFYRVKKVIE